MFQAIGLLLFTIFAAVAALVGGVAYKLLKMMFGSKEEAQVSRRSNTDPKLETARQRFEAELESIRRERKLQRKRRGGRKALNIVGGVGVGLMVFGLSFQFELFPLIGIGAGMLAAAVSIWLGGQLIAMLDEREEDRSIPVPQRPQIAAPEAQVQGLPSGRAELVQRVLGEAAKDLRNLDASISRLRHPDSISHVTQILASGNRLIKAVADQPDLLNTAQRVFTYYCPEAVKVAEGLAQLEAAPRLDMERIEATQTVLKKLAALFDRTELELRQGNAQALDIDVRLLDQSLEADLKTIS